MRAKRSGLERNRLAIIALILLHGPNSPGLAQVQRTTGTGGLVSYPAPADPSEYSKLSDQNRSEATTMAFGTCIVRTRRAAAEKALSLPPFKLGTSDRMASLATPGCLAGGAVWIPQEVLRGALFIALYRADYRKTPPSLRPDRVDYWADVGGPQDDPVLKGYVASRQFAECVVRDDAADAGSLILAAPGSSQERLALAALNPKLGPCVIRGTRISFSKMMLVGVLAEVIYRESIANAPS